MPAVTARARQALAFAQLAIATYGQRDAGSDLVSVPLSQAELARWADRSPGTISWYLRCLDDAVVVRHRDSLVFDVARLAHLEHRARRCPTPRATQLQHQLIDAFGSATPDAVAVPLAAAAGGAPSVRAVAERLDLSPSTAQRHLAALERTGRLRRDGAALYAVRDDEAQRAHSPTAPDRARLMALLEQVSQTLALMAAFVEELLLEDQPRILGDRDPRITRARPAKIRGAANSGGSRVIPKTEVGSEETFLPTSPPATVRAETSRPDSRIARSRDELAGLLAPLLLKADRLNLPGVSDWAGVKEALGPYGDAEVAHAVRELCREMSAGRMNNPVGVLVHRAREGSAIFTIVGPTRAGSGEHAVVAEDLEDATAEAEAATAVAAMEPAELAVLDDAVRKAMARARLPGGRDGDLLATADAAGTLAQWRQTVWRASRARREE